MNEISIIFPSSNTYKNDNDSEKDDFHMDNNSIIQFPFAKNSFILESSEEDKLNKDILKNFENPTKTEKKINVENFKIDQFELTIISTKDRSKFLWFKTKRTGDNHNSGINLDNKINLNENIKKKENIIIEINEKLKNNIEEKKSNLGRKRKGEKEKGIHDKNSEDNKMRKIKAIFLNECNNLLNSSLKDKNLKFINLNGKINSDLKKERNIKLLNSTIKDFYEKSLISGRYRSKKINLSNNNRILIKKIFEENEETETIKILNLTFRELLHILIRNISTISPQLKEKIKDISILNTNEYKNITYNFFETIRKKELNNYENEEDIKDYINKLGDLFIKYENWFSSKKGKNRIKKK